MQRRQVLGVIGGAAAFWSRPRALAQQPGRMPRVGVLSSQIQGDSETNDRIAALLNGLGKLGWSDGRNVIIDVRYAGGSPEALLASSRELIDLKPDVLFASATSALVALQKMTGTIPVVFAQVTDPVGAGFVKSLARPGGNITGFTQHDFSIGVKWLELLRELAPRVRRVGIVFDPNNPATAGYLTKIRDSAPSFDASVVELPVPVSGAHELAAAALDTAVERFSHGSDGGLIILPGPGPSIIVRRNQIVRLAERYRLPAVYPFRYWVSAGGLAFYGIDNIELHRNAAAYIDRILKGEKPGELPIQNAIKFELVINLKAARALGIEPSVTLLARADQVIESTD
ncbi:MAG: ABC transporter substrate-binding protein [Pseudorhodoplanes sp.]|uniref:ABC transporter substrate-binding protein n=1 Tax=Pseudorhodoplanes sp. TaxID=1934341 RepID=UPI003D0B7CCF